MNAVTVGLLAGMALGFAGYFGGFGAFLVVAVLGAVGLLIGSFVRGDINSSAFTRRRDEARRPQGDYTTSQNRYRRPQNNFGATRDRVQ